MALLDIIANNTDRKSGHCLLVRRPNAPASCGASITGCASLPEFKLRTVIWEFGGEPIPDALLEPVARLCERVPLEIAALLNDDEVEAIQGRAAWCVKERVFPDRPVAAAATRGR